MHTRVGGADCLQQGIKPPSTSTHTSRTDTTLSVGSDGLVSEPQPLASILQSLPTEVGGIRKHAVVYTCMDVSSRYLAVGSEQGYVWVLDIISGRLLRELSVSDVWLWLHCFETDEGTAFARQPCSQRPGNVASTNIQVSIVLLVG